jgi:hypothetical protein
MRKCELNFEQRSEHESCCQNSNTNLIRGEELEEKQFAQSFQQIMFKESTFFENNSDW